VRDSIYGPFILSRRVGTASEHFNVIYADDDTP
jgi:hypothetical protein